ncbi:prolyl oligopeptidase family serine peptidase [bacterium]|nr:prolyl oligopeptidase family serine peptidase [bacterium]MDB4794899.1 prolyl oligopeptidase family serine peptidase [bacterium]MDB4808062.1 prolyl oligopeptidase family serine peptidase [Verrucomicrobiota bacterium]
MKFKNALFNVITIKRFIIQKSPLLSGMILLNAGFLYCHAFDGDYVKLNIGDPGGNLPVTYRVSGSKMILSWKESGICEGSTDLKTWFGVGLGRRYNVNFNREHVYFRVKKALPRAVKTYIPKGYNSDNKYPLILNLHGYSLNSDWHNNYFSLKSLADEKGFIFCIPDGLRDSQNNQRWNATDACCGSRNDLSDDSKYLREVIDSAIKKFSVDRKRIYSMGFSNGGFMSYRIAYDHSDILAAIAPIAGVGYKDKNKVTPKHPVHLLHIHGTSDATVPFEGGNWGGPHFPGAVENLRNWAEYNKCNKEEEPKVKSIDIDNNIPGNDTAIIRFINEKNNCTVELWKVHGGQHIIPFTGDGQRMVVDWLLDHSKVE